MFLLFTKLFFRKKIENYKISKATEENINKQKQLNNINCKQANKPERLNEGPGVARIHLNRDCWISATRNKFVF